MTRAKRAAAALGCAAAAAGACNLVVLATPTEGLAWAMPNAPADCILVLGAGVEPTGPSPVLEDRLATALGLYGAGVARAVLVSGDHSRREYDEPSAMARWLTERGVPEQAVFLDHAGFDTHSSMVRARRVFGGERVVVVTQAFHLPRALYLARAAGLEAKGEPADRREYVAARWFAAREVASRTKAVVDAAVGRAPRFLGPPIDLGGDGRVTR